MPATTPQKRSAFYQLHQSGCFVMPNPWDVGSAVYLQSLGFKALASSSAGFAWAQGYKDNTVTRDMVLAHLSALSAAVDVPVNADFEGAFAHDADGVAANVTLAVSTGVSGLSVEDYTGDPAAPLYEFAHAVARIKAARAAIDATGANVVLTARTEGFLFGQPDLPETIRRLTAFAKAGADCVFAPGLPDDESIRAVVQAVSPKPVNIMGANTAFTVSGLANLGVRRISTGGAMARTAWGGFMRASQELAEQGTFNSLATAAKGESINQLFQRRSGR